jgi:hypothetical protein
MARFRAWLSASMVGLYAAPMGWMSGRSLSVSNTVMKRIVSPDGRGTRSRGVGVETELAGDGLGQLTLWAGRGRQVEVAHAAPNEHRDPVSLVDGVAQDPGGGAVVEHRVHALHPRLGSAGVEGLGDQPGDVGGGPQPLLALGRADLAFALDPLAGRAGLGHPGDEGDQSWRQRFAQEGDQCRCRRGGVEAVGLEVCSTFLDDSRLDSCTPRAARSTASTGR